MSPVAVRAGPAPERVLARAHRQPRPADQIYVYSSHHLRGDRTMEARYNVYFAGQLRAGHDLAGVRDQLARLFKADTATLDKLFSGKPQLVKRDCDKATALKYQQAMEQAGAVPIIKSLAQPAESEPAAAPGKAASMAERIAALAAAPDITYPHQTGKKTGPDTAQIQQSTQPDEAAEGGIRLAPAGTAVLLPQERPAPAISNVTPPDLEIFASGQRLSEPRPEPPPAPDTSHLSAGEAGELLPNLPSAGTRLAPDTSALSLAPDGTDLTDCAASKPRPPDIDLSSLELAPAGADVLEAQYRDRHDRPMPATDHLALED